MASIQAIWQEEIAPLKAIAGWLPAAIFQPFSKGLLEKAQQNGGNALGITTDDGPLTRKSRIPSSKHSLNWAQTTNINQVFNTALQWSDEADDARVFAAARNTINRSVAEAEKRGLSFRYIYQNYASAEQDVFDGYGSANHAKLQAISKKYDPTGVFQTLQPGYFKLF